jgi:peptide/nickel transport system permease protein
MKRLLEPLTRQPLGIVGAVLLALLALAALLAPYVAPFDPWERGTPMLAPSGEHLLGTNDVGQDLLSELLYGARNSLLIAAVASVGATAIGLVLGLISGYYSKFGFVAMRLVDISLLIPRFPLIILMATLLAPSVWNLILLFTALGWPSTTRIIRSAVLSHRNREYVDGVQMLGARDPYVLRRYIFPQVLPLAIVQLVLEASYVILAESGIAFLGLGDPTAKSWGTMLHYAFEYPAIFVSDVWVRWMLPAGVCISLTVLALVFLGHALEEWANPRLKQWAPARM